MVFHRYFQSIFFICLIFVWGCSILPKKQPDSTVIVDPLIERNKQWRKHIEDGNTLFQEGRLRDAINSYQSAINLRPKNSEPHYNIAEIYLQLEEFENALNAFIAFLEIEPNNINALNYVGFIYEQLSNFDKAAQYYERVLKISKDNLYALNHLALAYIQLNRLDEAETQLRKALLLDPQCEKLGSENLHNYLALIHLQRGDIGEGIAELRESIRLFPNDIWPRKKLASLYEDYRRYLEAQIQYKKLLEVDPENLYAKTRLEVLSKLNSNANQIKAVLPVPILEPDVNDIITNAPDATDYPDADVVILFNHFSHDVLSNGQSRYTTHQVVKLLNERGVQKYGDIAIPYQPNAQNIGINIARTITPDGTIHFPPAEAFNDVTPPGLLSYNLYSDMMWRVISMVALTPGVCIEYQVTLEDKLENVTGNGVWITGGYNFQSSEVTLDSTYALRLPQDLSIQWKTDNIDIKPEITYEENGVVMYIWRSGEMPALQLEEGMPNINDIAPRLKYSSIQSWDDVYRWYKDLTKGRYAPDENLNATVEMLTENLSTDEEMIRTLYNFVARNIRYVGIELGQSAYQPSPASEVLKKKYGDCKDKTTLLISMLDLVGIKAYPVMISAAPYEKIDTSLPSLSQFNHMIVAIPIGKDDYIWLDATSSTCNYGNLPYHDQGRNGLFIGDTQWKFVETPVFPAESNRIKSTTELWLNNNGNASGEIRINMTGQNSTDARWEYKQISRNKWNDTLASDLSEQIPDIIVDSVHITGLDNLDSPVDIDVKFHVEKYAKQLNGQVLLPLPIDEFSDYASIVSAAERKYPIELRYPMKIEKLIRLHLPDEWDAVLPLDYSFTTSFAEIERQLNQHDNVVIYRLVFTLNQRIIPVIAYSEVKQLFTQLASEDGSKLLININREMLPQ